MAPFVHLHTHSEYSIVDATLRVKEAVTLAADSEQPALALTDQMNMFALVKFYSAAQSAGIKPLIGADLWVENAEEETFQVTCLCQTNQGYLNLSHLISLAWLKNQKLVGHEERPLISQDWLARYNEGLIILSGNLHGDVGQAMSAQKPHLAAKRLEWWQQTFPDRYYLELVRTGRAGEEAHIAAALEAAERYDLPVVATNDVRFARSDDFDAHEVRVCINEGVVLEDPNRSHRYSDEQYFRTSDEMQALFADIPEALENTVEIARRCNVSLTLGTYFLPDFPVPDGMTMDEYFIAESRKGLDERLAFLFPELTPAELTERRKPYDERLKFELDIILQMGFPGYFFIVADFIQWGKDHGVPVGPGRGSGAGSLVAYALKITDLDPLQYDLLFERFLNPERVSMPDFDVDFCMERRDEVIEYVARQYGQDHVSQIVTFGTMAAKAVIRDVGRVLGHSYGMVDSIAKMVPNDLGIKLQEALDQEEDLQQRYQQDEEVQTLLDLALKLEGTVRNTGKHAGGVVIGPKPLDHFCPLLSEADGTSVVTQLDKNDVETAGLVKFDFLGLRTLTIIDWALHFINEGKSPGDEGFVDINAIPMDDQPTFDMIKTGKTTGVFQLESSGMQNLIVRLKPDCFEDIIALVALFRPGPLESGMVDNFINRKHGKEKVAYPDPNYQHELLKPILEPTYGVILYQEQVMQIAQVLAGYSLGKADMLRRAMGKKKPEEMAKQRSVFKEGAEANGIDGDLAMKIFDLVEKFAGYGFNKSHSAAYALVSYQSAWLKKHYPAEFMAAQISSDMDNTDKVVHMVNECQAMGIEVMQPDINLGEIHFKAVRGEKTVRYGLGAIKGVGEAALEGVIAERKANGPYTGLFDLCARSNRKLNRRVLEALILSGALDSLHDNRQAMLSTVPNALQKAEQKQKDEEAGQSDLFGDALSFEAENADELVAVSEMSQKKRLKGEKDTLGLYMTGHPIEIYRKELADLVDQDLKSLRPEKWKKVWVAGLVVAARSKVTRSGSRMGFAAIDDQTARVEVVLRPNVFEGCREILVPDAVVLIHGEVSEDTFNGGIKIDAEQVVTLAESRQERAKGIKIRPSMPLTESVVHELATVLGHYQREEDPEQPAGLPVVVDYENDQAWVQMKSVGRYAPDDALIEWLDASGWQPKVVIK
ncbi:DNA polymerase III subunit alpha [Thiomicrospira sp. WB1]|uniref:DNA polymerase III subunit alpha n=1 Tax=Thiomicrospira sp. WB1 TaxID=1685380 RepID=UPI0007471FD9|nr:DNA polymerase III subunit alpha [Thiomicrospira sp. WB1]KUJ72218.1 DNA polymerase III subunit alpha [Thiomicrospira sp. WB1]